MTEKEKKNRDKLFRLMRENPDLPVVPMVDYEIVQDGFGRWLGAWGSANIDEYLIADEQVYFKSYDDVMDVLARFLNDEDYEALPDSKTECREFYEALPWIKAIIVNINLPECEWD